jgi:hypothetical protein
VCAAVATLGLVLATQAGCPTANTQAICENLASCAEAGGADVPDEAVGACAAALPGLQLASPACYNCIAAADDCNYDACEEPCGDLLATLGFDDLGDE